MTDGTDGPRVLVTAFEPSGDALAASFIAELKRRAPGCVVYGLGGPAMRAAGAELLEETTGRAVMLAEAWREALAHRARLRRLRTWLAEHPLDAVVPVDSPAANWGVCKLTRRAQPGARIVHLVMPQLWAWATWRLSKLKRLSDHVLCLLPFERDWLAKRGVPATFVGHPLFDAAHGKAHAPESDGATHPQNTPSQNTPSGTPSDANDAPSEPASDAHAAPRGAKLALLPGSRESEVKANWPTMHAAYQELRAELPALSACVAASDAARRDQLESLLPDGAWPEGMRVVTGDANAVLEWSDAALVVSGTATLHTASRGKPMVVLYNVSPWSWQLAGRWLVSTRTFSLPNLIAEHDGRGRVVPELVPHFGEVAPVIAALRPLLVDEAARAAQASALAQIGQRFAGPRFASVAVDTLLGLIERA